MVALTFFSCQIYSTSVSLTSSPWFSTNLTEFSVWNLVCGFAQTKGQLIAFRFLAGVGGSAPLSVSMPLLKKNPPCTRLLHTL
jgi:MFS family permease